MTNKLATLALAGLLAASTAALGGCERSASAVSNGGDKYAGLDEAIHGWRDAIVASQPACRAKAGDKGCQSFEVACKAERPIGPGEQAKGVSAKVVVAMRWQGWNAAKDEFQDAPGFAEFAKVGDAWRRREAGRVNLSTCA
jgi:hypothetical protein